MTDRVDGVFDDVAAPAYPQFETVELKVDGDVAVLTLGAPDTQSAPTTTMTPELTACFKIMRGDPGIRALVITGRGKRFSSGGDIGLMKSRSEAMKVPENPAWVQRLPVDHGTDFMNAFLDLPFPVVAAVNGHAVGAGMRIVLLSDLVIVAEEAKMGDTHVNRGLVAPQPFLLEAAVGVSRAKALLLTGRLVSGAEAVSFGLADRAVPRDDVVEAAMNQARQLADLPPLAVRWTKRLLNNRLRAAVASYATEAYALESLTMLSSDHAEAAGAFLEKRDPHRFEGR